MDPNANLKKQRQFAHEIINGYQHNAERLAELVDALDAWILKGGFLPEDWTAGTLTLLRKVKGDTDTFKCITFSVAQYGAYVEVFWRKEDMFNPAVECNFFDGGRGKDAHEAGVLATLLKIGAGVAASWQNDPPWDRSISGSR